MDSLGNLVRDLAVAAPPTLINPYACFDPDLDRPGGAAIRAATLLAYLEARSTPALLLVGEAAGYQGCRFSEGWREPSATIVHDALRELGLEDRTILWNVVPFHPAGLSPLSNRTPIAAERWAATEWLRRIRAITQPGVVAAIGRVAEAALGPGTPYLRHPAHGGAARFRDGLGQLAREHGLV